MANTPTPTQPHENANDEKVPPHGPEGQNGVEEQGQGQLEAEDFYSEKHFVDEPDERNLK